MAPAAPVFEPDPEREAIRAALAAKATQINQMQSMTANPVPKTMCKLGMQNHGGWFKKVDLRTTSEEAPKQEVDELGQPITRPEKEKPKQEDDIGRVGPKYVQLAPDGLFERLYGGEKLRVYEAKMLEARRALKGGGASDEDAVIQGVMAGLACEGGGAAKFLFGTDYGAGLAEPASGAGPVRVAKNKAGEELTRQLLEALGPAADGAASAAAPAVELPPDDGLGKLSVKELKRRMAEAGVDATGLAEKSELVDALRKASAEPPAKRPCAEGRDPPAAPAAPAGAASGAWV